MKSIASTLAATLVLASAMFASDIRQKRYNLENDSLAIQGYDPVSYFSGDPKEGDPSLLYEYKGVAYQFANEANLNAFKANPKKYEPKYGGWCAYAMLDGDRTDINPETYKIIGDKLYGPEGAAPFLEAIDEGLSAGLLARLGHPRQALHASWLQVPHPAAREPLRVESPLPWDLVRLWANPRAALAGEAQVSFEALLAPPE